MGKGEILSSFQHSQEPKISDTVSHTGGLYSAQGEAASWKGAEAKREGLKESAFMGKGERERPSKEGATGIRGGSGSRGLEDRADRHKATRSADQQAFKKPGLRVSIISQSESLLIDSSPSLFLPFFVFPSLSVTVPCK